MLRLLRSPILTLVLVAGGADGLASAREEAPSFRLDGAGAIAAMPREAEATSRGPCGCPSKILASLFVVAERGLGLEARAPNLLSLAGPGLAVVPSERHGAALVARAARHPMLAGRAFEVVPVADAAAR